MVASSPKCEMGAPQFQWELHSFNGSSTASLPGQVRLVDLCITINTKQNQGRRKGKKWKKKKKKHLICFKFTEVLIFWDVFLLYIFVNAKCFSLPNTLNMQGESDSAFASSLCLNQTQSCWAVVLLGFFFFARHRFPSYTHSF